MDKDIRKDRREPRKRVSLSEDARVPMIVLQFGKSWDEQLSILPHGSSVTIRGKMGSASLAAIHLEECELL
jgi:hypothetical protein